MKIRTAFFSVSLATSDDQQVRLSGQLDFVWLEAGDIAKATIVAVVAASRV